MNCETCFCRLHIGQVRVLGGAAFLTGAAARLRGARGAAGARGVVERVEARFAVGSTIGRGGGAATGQGGAARSRPTVRKASSISSGTSLYQLPLPNRLGIPDSSRT